MASKASVKCAQCGYLTTREAPCGEPGCPVPAPMSRNDEPKKESIETLPGPVQEAINTYARYYAEHHKLGMSIRDDLIYIAHVAMRWRPESIAVVNDGGIDIAQELRTVMAREENRMGAMSAGVLRQVIERIERAPVSEKQAIPDGWKLVCEQCGADFGQVCGAPASCATKHVMPEAPHG